MDVGTGVALAVAKDTVVDIVVCRKRDSLDDGRRQAGDEQQRKGDQQ